MASDVFLSHDSSDKAEVEAIARRLREAGIEPWLDKWHLIPGDPWQPAIEAALQETKSCAVFIGKAGIGPWQHEEMRAAVARRVESNGVPFRVIPVLLPEAHRPVRSKLPNFLVATTWVEFGDGLRDPAALHALICGVRGLPPVAAPERAGDATHCPYRGLKAFDVADAPFFFGRAALTGWLVNALRPALDGNANRFLAIVGASGSGKSSLARAGLLAALKVGAIATSASWPTVIVRPGAEPLESLATAVLGKLDPKRQLDLGRTMAELRAEPRTLHRAIRLQLAEQPEQRLLLLVDQFEEVFTLCKDELERRAFVESLVHAATVARGQLVVVLTMRADFYGKCAAYPTLAAAVSDQQLLVGPMTNAELREAIQRPAELTGLAFEPALLERLLHDLDSQPGMLPLLQHALFELWHAPDNGRLTLARYEAIGGIAGALEQRANQVLAALSETEREACRRLFLRLTQPGEGTGDTKRRITLREALEAPESEALVAKLTDARLLTTEGTRDAPESFVEVAHEALIRNWSALRGWIEADRSGLRAHHRLSEAVVQWLKQARDPSYLFSGTRLLVTTDWARKNLPVLSDPERDFLLFSLMEDGATLDWLPKLWDLPRLLYLLSPFLEGARPSDRLKGLSVLGKLAGSESEPTLQSYLLKQALEDGSLDVRARAAQVLCERGHLPWLMAKVDDSRQKSRLLDAISHCCNVPGLGPQVRRQIPAKYATSIRLRSTLALFGQSLPSLAIVFAITYGIALTFSQLWAAAMTVLGDSRGFVGIPLPITPLELAGCAVVAAYLQRRARIEAQPRGRWQTLSAASIIIVLSNLVSLIGLMAIDTDLARRILYCANVISALSVAPFLVWHLNRPRTDPPRDWLHAAILAAIGGGVLALLTSVLSAQLDELPYRVRPFEFAVLFVVATVQLRATMAGVRAAHRVAGL